MTVVSGATWTGVIVTKNTTGALVAPTVGPAGVLYVNGMANAAVVAIAGTNPYSWTVTLPVLADGDCVSMYITATIAGIATAGVVAEDVVSTVYLSSRGTADPGDAMTLTAGERIATAAVVLTQILEGVHTVGDGLRIMLAALAGKSTGGGTFTNRFRDVADSKNRIDATVDANGNRTVITIDGT